MVPRLSRAAGHTSFPAPPRIAIGLDREMGDPAAARGGCAACWLRGWDVPPTGRFSVPSSMPLRARMTGAMVKRVLKIAIGCVLALFAALILLGLLRGLCSRLFIQALPSEK